MTNYKRVLPTFSALGLAIFLVACNHTTETAAQVSNTNMPELEQHESVSGDDLGLRAPWCHGAPVSTSPIQTATIAEFDAIYSANPGICSGFGRNDGLCLDQLADQICNERFPPGYNYSPSPAGYTGVLDYQSGAPWFVSGGTRLKNRHYAVTINSDGNYEFECKSCGTVNYPPVLIEVPHIPHDETQIECLIKADDNGPRSKGLTFTKLGTDTVTGALHVGADPDSNPFQGDVKCDAKLPLLCINDDAQYPVPQSLDVTDNAIPWPQSSNFHAWSRGSLATTPPVQGCILSNLADANDLCAAEFGTGWRTAEWHDGVGYSMWGYGNMPTDTTRAWVDIQNQPSGTCWAP